MIRKIGAWLNLTWYFALHVLTRWWLRPFRHGRDLARFTSTIGPEGYVPLEPATRAGFVPMMKCIHCGLCAIACSPLQNTPSSAWDEPWTFAGGASRSLDYASLVARDITACTSDPLPESVCPMGVPIRAMAENIRRLSPQ